MGSLQCSFGLLSWADTEYLGLTQDDVESGASWALELGGEDTGRPPILVKNLNQPRQLLVEVRLNCL